MYLGKAPHILQLLTLPVTQFSISAFKDSIDANYDLSWLPGLFNHLVAHALFASSPAPALTLSHGACEALGRRHAGSYLWP